MATTPDYISELKNYLDITWTDTSGEAKLVSLAKKAESYLSKKAGETLSFSLNMEDQSLLQLLYDCIRYMRSNAIDEFGTNYFSELTMLRMNAQSADEEVEDDEEA